MMKIAGITKLCTRLSGIAIALAALFYTPVLLAQNVTGTISGTVADPSGAVIPGAHVTAENTGTGVKTESTTNASGDYAVRFLPIGTYRVTVEAKGFNSQVIPPFALEINQTVKMNTSLTVGSSNTNVEVKGEVAPILNTTDSSLGITLSTNEIANIPLNGRNFSAVTLFQPGAVTTTPQGFSGQNAIERSSNANGTNDLPSVNGNRTQANNYTLEGADLNESQNNLIGYNPSPDALGEVKVISSNAPASYGNVNGGAVVSLLKSGTNQFHGSAFIFLENYNLDANTFSNKYTPTASSIQPKTAYTQTIFGGTLGGPIWKNKLFFFMDYEGVRHHGSGSTTPVSVLSQAMRNGDFSAILPSNQLYDTQNNYAPYANNQVPILNPVAKFLFAHPELYPLPNVPATDGIIAGNYQGTTRTSQRNDQGDIKIEYDKTSADRFTAFYAQSNPGDMATALIPVSFPAVNTYPTKLGGGSWIHTFSSAIVNEARIGFTRIRWDNGIPTDPGGFFGLSGDAKVGIPFPNQEFPGFTNQSFGNAGGVVGTANSVGTSANLQVFRDNTFNYQDNLTWQYGRHLFSIGVQAIRYQQNYVNADNFGFLGQQTYSGIFTSSAGGSGGYGAADFVLDRIFNTQIASAGDRFSQRQWRDAGYVQDDFKVTPKLTLNIGLRYEYDQPWYEKNNKTANVILATGQVEYAGSLPVGAVPGSKVCPTRACYEATYNQFMPRLGFAYQVMPRFVIRGGYGSTSFFEGYSFNQRLTSSPPFASGGNVNSVTPSPGNPGTPRTAEQGFPSLQNSSTYSVWPQKTVPAYISEFNLTLETEITNTLTLSVGYVGQTGQHLADYRNGNQLTLAQAAIAASSPDPNNPLPGGVAPFANLVGQNGALLITESGAMSNYNGGQVTLRERATHGVEFTANYTYAKAMTNSGGDYEYVNNVNGGNGAFQDGYNSRADYGPADQDVRHNFNFIGVYAVPYGRGQQHGGSVNRLIDLVAGGWKISTSFIDYSGFPLTINGPNNTNTNTYGNVRANHYRKLIIRNQSLNNWFGTDPSAIPCPTTADNGICAYGPSAEFGTATIGSERAPGYKQVDASAFKDFHLFASHSLGFRADFFNLMNISSYGNPQNNVSNPNTLTDGSYSGFGLINNVRSPARQIQFSAHYNF